MPRDRKLSPTVPVLSNILLPKYESAFSDPCTLEASLCLKIQVVFLRPTQTPGAHTSGATTVRGADVNGFGLDV